VDDRELAEYVDAVRAGGWNASWGYHSRASVLHRYVAMAVPKVACSTLKLALQTYEGCAPEGDRWWEVHAGDAGPTLLAYPTEQVVEMLRSPDYLRFCFVRNPYSRLFSAWKSKLASDDDQYAPLRAAIRDAFDYPEVGDQRVGRVAFRDAVDCVLANRAAFDDHWTPQVDVLVLDVIRYDVVGRFERFVEEFSAILTRLHAPPPVVKLASRVLNPTQPMSLAAVYDRELARRVHDHYVGDFDTFGYDADSWRFE